MYSYISKIGDDVYVIKEKQLIKYNIKTKHYTYQNYENKLVYIKNSYVIDSQKNLYKFTIDSFITKLQKNITTLQYKEKIYICNRFGDVNIIEEERTSDKEKLLFGNLCMTTCMILDQNIWTGDKYGRIRVSEYSSKIIKYIFLNAYIVCMEIYNGRMYVSTKNNEKTKLQIIDMKTFSIETFDFVDVIKKFMINNNLFLIGNKGIYKFVDNSKCDLKKEKNDCVNNESTKFLTVTEYIKGDFIDGIVCKNEILLTKNGDLIVDNVIALSLDYVYNDNAIPINE